jgi:hypothetical protein
MGDNLQARVMRLEPDFNMVGTMTVEVVGGDTAQSPATSRQAYPFDGTTEKIDMREQLRTLYLRFASNDIGGDYTMGRVIMHVEPGDERG